MWNACIISGLILVIVGLIGGGYVLKSINIFGVELGKEDSKSVLVGDQALKQEIQQIHSGSGDNVAGNKIINQTEPPQRHLTSEEVAYIDSRLPEDKNVEMWVYYLRMDSGESRNFAIEIRDYLKQKGYVDIRMAETISPGFPDGLTMGIKSGDFVIKVGKGPKSIVD